jgi:hypothetical protein
MPDEASEADASAVCRPVQSASGLCLAGEEFVAGMHMQAGNSCRDQTNITCLEHCNT